MAPLRDGSGDRGDEKRVFYPIDTPLLPGTYVLNNWQALECKIGETVEVMVGGSAERCHVPSCVHNIFRSIVTCNAG